MNLSMAMAVIVKEEIMNDDVKSIVRVEQTVLAHVYSKRNHSEHTNIPSNSKTANIMSLIAWPAISTRVDVCSFELRLIV